MHRQLLSKVLQVAPLGIGQRLVGLEGNCGGLRADEWGRRRRLVDVRAEDAGRRVDKAEGLGAAKSRHR